MGGESTNLTVLDLPDERSRSIATPGEAMAQIEAHRARVFSIALAAISGGAIPLVLACGGDPRARWPHVAALAATMIAAVMHALHVRDLRKHRRWQTIALACVAVIANGTGYMFWGVYSAYGSVVPVSAYAFATGSGRRDGIYLLVGSVLFHGGLGLATLYGWWTIPSIVPPPDLPTPALLALLATLQIVLVVAIFGGHDAYRTLARVIAEHGEAQRALAVRDAQLAEAQEAVRDARAADEGRHTGGRLGRFALGQVLGRGAMGEVYAAHDDAGVKCAVKVLAREMMGNQEAIARFQREARVIAALDSPNIVRMIDVSPAGADVPFMAMERLAGRDLGEMVQEQPVRELGEVVAIVRAVAAGLDVAHAAGVVHRDLKPANVFAAQTADGGTVTWKILDFGVSKAFHGEATLGAGLVVGTPGYMAPEQAKGESVDRRADVYSLGIVAYRLLTGRPAVVPGDVPAMIHEVVYRMPPAPIVPPDVAAVLAVALAKSPGDRFATAGELAVALAEAASGSLPAGIAQRATALQSKLAWGQWVRDRKKTIAG